MKKWTCNVCGYTHQGEAAPEHCPQCGASKSQFSQEKKNSGCVITLFLILSILAILFFTFMACRSSTAVDNSTVGVVDMDRYMGKWYEIARLNHRFERGMTYCTAFYKLQDNGSIKITNRGKKDGKWKTSEGKAKLGEEPGVIRVSFFGPFYSDYRIMMLAPDYSYALVGSGSDGYLWLLSRTPQVTPVVRQRMVAEARSRGYDVDRLIWVQQ